MLEGWYKLEDGNEDGLIQTSCGRRQFWVRFESGQMIDATHPGKPWASFEEAAKLHPWIARPSRVPSMVKIARRYETRYWGGKTAEQLIAEAEQRKMRNQSGPTVFLFGFGILSAALLAKRAQLRKQKDQHETHTNQGRAQLHS